MTGAVRRITAFPVRKLWWSIQADLPEFLGGSLLVGGRALQDPASYEQETAEKLWQVSLELTTKAS